MKPSLTPLLLITELAFLLFVFRGASGGQRRAPRLLMAFWLRIVGYAVLAAYLGFRGVYVSDALLVYLPGLWVQSVTVVVCVAPVLASRRVRELLRRAVDATAAEHFIYFQMLRLAAVGTLWGATSGEFPLYFELLVGLPDLAFALSTFWALRLARSGRLTDRMFLYWNLVGALVIVPAAPVLLQLGLPGPWQVFAGPPDARAVFEFPMSLASVVGVPLFVLVNLLVVWRTAERTMASRSESTAGALIA